MGRQETKRGEIKHIIIPIVVLAIIIGFGIFEAMCVKKIYKDFENKIDNLIESCRNETLDVDSYAVFCQEWLKVREKSELFLPHNDVYEMNLRVSEIKTYVEQEDYELCLAHLSVMKDLAKYISHLATPSIQHVL